MLTSEATTVRVVEPEELTPYLNLEGSPDNDALLTMLILAATDKVESLTGRALITREFTEVRSTCDWLRRTHFMRGPVTEIVSVTADDEQLESDKYELLNDSVYYDPPHFCNKRVTLVYKAGYGDSAADIPAALKLAICRIVATQFEHRENVVVGTITAVLPPEVTGIISQYRRQLL